MLDYAFGSKRLNLCVAWFWKGGRVCQVHAPLGEGHCTPFGHTTRLGCAVLYSPFGWCLHEVDTLIFIQ